MIYHLETFDVTTVRASTPMFLLARRVKATGCKMVLSGEGADEIFGGYLYFHKLVEKKRDLNVLSATKIADAKKRFGCRSFYCYHCCCFLFKKGEVLVVIDLVLVGIFA